MSWDQAAFSFEQGQPPTPSKTPNSFSPVDSFSTPRLESSFYDPRVTWDTANPTIGSPILLRTPRPLSFGAAGGLSAAQSPTQAEYARFGPDFASNAQKLLSTPNFGTLNTDGTPRIGSDATVPAEQEKLTPSQLGLSLDTSDLRAAHSIQTPPPTSTSASKRKAQQKQAAELFQQSRSATARRMSGPPLAPRLDNNGDPASSSALPSQMDESSQQFAPLDFSPDIFGYNFAAPATAPPYPQHKLFWEGDSSNQNDDFDFANVPNPFDTPRQSATAPFSSDDHVQAPSSSAAPATSSFMDFSDDITPMQSFVQSNFAQTSTQGPNSTSQPQAKQLHNGVDPSLLFSSPSKITAPLTGGSMASSRVLTEESLQPYAHQVQEARRERSLGGGISKSKKRRKPSVDSPAVQAALETLREDGNRRPPIARSMTDSVVSAVSRESGSSKPGSSHGRSSPLKGNLGLAKRRHRTSLALTIDENGRARTEQCIIEDSEGSARSSRMDVDSLSEESDSGSESSESVEDAMVTSFAQRVSQPKMGRFVSSSRAQASSHSQKSSYASFYSSTSHQDEQQQKQPSLPEQRRDIGGRRSGAGTLGQQLKPAMSTIVKDNEDAASEAETVLQPLVEEDDSNAQSELRKVMRNRHASASSSRGGGATTQQQQQQPMHHVYSPYSKHTAHFLPQGSNEYGMINNTNISPTTMTDPDLAATPSSGKSSSSPGIIRCVCNVPQDDGQMIQCESCRNWLHLPCAGINPQRVPQIYLCLFCTGATPTVRGGRVRDPSRKGGQGPGPGSSGGQGYNSMQANSPLAQKASRFR